MRFGGVSTRRYCFYFSGLADKPPGDRAVGFVADDHAGVVDSGGYGLGGQRMAERDYLSIAVANETAGDVVPVEVVAGDQSLVIDGDGDGIYVEDSESAEPRET